MPRTIATILFCLGVTCLEAAHAEYVVKAYTEGLPAAEVSRKKREDSPNIYHSGETLRAEAFEVFNSGTTPIRNLQLSLPRGLAKGLKNNTCGTSLAVGESCSFVVEYADEAASWDRTALTVSGAGLQSVSAAKPGGVTRVELQDSDDGKTSLVIDNPARSNSQTPATAPPRAASTRSPTSSASAPEATTAGATPPPQPTTAPSPEGRDDGKKWLLWLALAVAGALVLSVARKLFR